MYNLGFLEVQFRGELAHSATRDPQQPILAPEAHQKLSALAARSLANGLLGKRANRFDGGLALSAEHIATLLCALFLRHFRPLVMNGHVFVAMPPLQLRETTMDPSTRRLVQLTVDAKDEADQVMDMLLAKKGSADRREWLEQGDLADVVG